MDSTKTTNLSRNSSQKNMKSNSQISPSKVKLDIHKEVRENEEEDRH